MATLTPKFNQITEGIPKEGKENCSISNFRSIVKTKGQKMGNEEDDLLGKEPTSPLNTSQSSTSDKETSTKDEQKTARTSRLGAIRRWRKSKATDQKEDQKKGIQGKYENHVSAHPVLKTPKHTLETVKDFIVPFMNEKQGNNMNVSIKILKIE